jgi:hypothetical protein
MSMRHTLRQWKRQIRSQWGRLSPLMRACAGLAAAVAMAYYVIDFKVKPLQAERLKVEKEMQTKQVPAYVPPPSEDNELDETNLKIESLRTSLDSRREALAETIRSARAATANEEGRVINAFDKLVFESGLDPISRVREKPQEIAGRMSVSEYSYVLAGTFEQIRTFLAAVGRFENACEIADVSVHNADTCKDGKPVRTPPKGASAAGGSRAPLLHLEFSLKLYLIEEGVR